MNDIKTLQAQLAEARAARIVPGKMRCAKCEFTLIRTTLYMRCGNAGPGDNKSEPCPNGCGPLWPQTWEREARELGERLEQLWREKRQANAYTTSLRVELANLRASCEEREKSQLKMVQDFNARERDRGASVLGRVSNDD